MLLQSRSAELLHSDIPTSGVHVIPHPSTWPKSSPSLGSSNGAFEMKSLVDDDRARIIMAWARRHLAADPHAGHELADGYHVNSLYLDTPGFDTYRRNRFFRRRKFRLRRYGQEPTIWLELKRKRNGQVRKRRVCVEETDLIRHLTQPADLDWDGAWFRRRLDQRQLRPACQVTYRRFARIGLSSTGPIRLTLDSDLFTSDAADWRVPTASLAGESLLDGRQILEMKFRDVLPASFRGLIQDLRLEPGAFSKYRESVAASVPLLRLAGESV